eukprot:1137974-Pelagomonas_calceolata.AAC.3
MLLNTGPRDIHIHHTWLWTACRLAPPFAHTTSACSATQSELQRGYKSWNGTSKCLGLGIPKSYPHLFSYEKKALCTLKVHLKPLYP